ncbi:hypothetical protein Tco_1155043 [Tanacetum coccineum]
MQELREYTFSGNKNEDAHDHVDRVLNTVDGWIDSLQELSTLGTSLKKPLSKGIVHHPRPLNDLKTSTMSSRKAMNCYTKLGNGLSTMNHQILVSQGPIPGMTPTQALTAIQSMADHSQKWHEGTSSRNISSNSNTDGLAAIVSKLDNLGRDMKKLKENVHAIQVGCQICKGPHLDKEFPPGYYTRTDNRPPYGEKRPSLEELMNKHREESERRSVEMKEYGGCQLNDLIWGQSYAEWYKENLHDNKPRPRDYTFREWMIVTVGHTNVNKSVNKALLKSWVVDCFEEALDPDKDPRERSFNDYKWVFDLESEQLADESELGIGK